MKMDNDVYFRLACRLRRETGKGLRCCYFCVAYCRGDYRKALEFTRGKAVPSEDGRRRAA